MLSIIIPALNEEKHLAALLDSIKAQDYADYEIIVADAGSRDKTRKIARSHDCQIVAGGLPGKGRNEGAKLAQGDVLLFLDADVVLKKGFLRKAVDEFYSRRLAVGSFCLEPQTGPLARFSFNLFYNWPIEFCEPFLAHGAQAIMSRRLVHDQIGGFDETIRLAEDHDYVRRAKGVGRFAILRCGKVLISVRRFQTDGWMKTYLKFLAVEIYTVLVGGVRTDVFKYRFGHYTNDGK